MWFQTPPQQPNRPSKTQRPRTPIRFTRMLRQIPQPLHKTVARLTMAAAAAPLAMERLVEQRKTRRLQTQPDPRSRKKLLRRRRSRSQPPRVQPPYAHRRPFRLSVRKIAWWMRENDIFTDVECGPTAIWRREI